MFHGRNEVYIEDKMSVWIIYMDMVDTNSTRSCHRCNLKPKCSQNELNQFDVLGEKGEVG